MREVFLSFLVEKGRQRLMDAAAKCPAEARGVVPAGFNNNAHWQLGHIVTIADGLIFGLAGLERTVPAHYRTYFGNGTKPADWDANVPSWEELVGVLQQQSERILGLAEKRDAAVKENFFKGETLEEALLFNLNHEAVHTGQLSALIRLASTSN